MDGVEARIGRVSGAGGELDVSVAVDASGRVWIDLFASGYDGAGVLVRLRPDALEGLEAKIREAKETAARMAVR